MGVQVEATYGATKKFIAAGLESFNRQHMTRSPPKSFALTAREGGKARGGLMAEGIGEWIHISLLWVEDGFRRRGHGSSLLLKAEAEAKHRGAKGILVDTFSFQAPAFYEVRGFEVVAIIDNHPRSHQNLLMRKRLRSVS